MDTSLKQVDDACSYHVRRRREDLTGCSAGLSGVRRSYRAIQKHILQVATTIEYRHHIHRLTGHAINHTPWSDHQLSVRDQTVDFQFRDDASPVRKLFQAGGRGFKLMKRPKRGARIMNSKVIHNGKNITLGNAGELNRIVSGNRHATPAVSTAFSSPGQIHPRLSPYDQPECPSPPGRPA